MGCPEENVVVDFVQGELSDGDRSGVEAHLDGCPRCLALVSDLARVYGVDRRASALRTLAASEDRIGSIGTSTPQAGSDPAPLVERGTKLGRYVVLDPVGSGGMGIVYAAYDPELDRKIALKVLRDVGPEHRQRLLREGQAMARLSHPNVITVHDVGTWDERLYVAMEFVEGGTLGKWLTERPRRWTQVLDVFAAAGRGLAAAHAAGIVHRDFKPANVLIGATDGAEDSQALRPRVTDFGLARPGAGAPTATGNEAVVLPDVLHESGGRAALTASLTHTGALVGTPAYMSPEQYDQRPADERSDQFSFCVALFEGLFGRRPFAGRTVAELAANVSTESIQAPTDRRGVPPRVLRALRRGLRADPAARFENMAALLAELRRDPAGRWWKWGGIAFPMIGAGVIALAATADENAVCSDPEQRLGEAWSPARRDAVHVAFTATAVPFAEDAWKATARELDAYATAWAEGWEDACTASHVRGEQSDSLLDLRMSCLAERRAQLDALSEILTTADADVVARTSDAVAELLPVSDCADVEMLTARVPLPDDPRVRERIAALQAELARASALRATSTDIEEALKIARDVAAEARELGYMPLAARALHRVSTLVDDPEREEETLVTALEAGVEGRDDRAAATAAAELAGRIGEDPQRAREAEAWLRMAQALARRMGNDESIEIRVLEKRALWAARRGDHDEALELGREVVERVRALHGPDHPRVAVALGNLGQILHRAGKFDEARRAHREALTIDEAARGPNHPDVSLSLNNLAATHLQVGEYAEALPYLERALRIRRAVFGPDSPRLVSALQSLGMAQRGDDRHEDADASFRRVLEIVEAKLGPDHPRIAAIRLDMGITAFERGDHEEALAQYQAALALREKTAGIDDPSTAIVRYNVGEALERLDRYDEALDQHQRALSVLEAAHGPQHYLVAYPMGGLGRVRLQRGELGRARELLERSLAIHEASSAPPIERANVRFALARVLDAQGDRARARELATLAADELAPTKTAGRDLRAAVAAFLVRSAQ